MNTTSLERRIGQVATMLLLCVVALSASLFATGATSATDLEVQEIDSRRISCGNCSSSVRVLIVNRGRALDVQYRVQVDLQIGPKGGSRQQLRLEQSGFPDGSQTFDFKGVRLSSCDQGEILMEAEVAIVSGNFRESNTYNNKKRVSRTIQRRCP